MLFLKKEVHTNLRDIIPISWWMKPLIATKIWEGCWTNEKFHPCFTIFIHEYGWKYWKSLSARLLKENEIKYTASAPFAVEYSVYSRIFGMILIKIQCRVKLEKHKCNKVTRPQLAWCWAPFLHEKKVSPGSSLLGTRNYYAAAEMADRKQGRADEITLCLQILPRHSTDNVGAETSTTPLCSDCSLLWPRVL